MHFDAGRREPADVGASAVDADDLLAARAQGERGGHARAGQADDEIGAAGQGRARLHAAMQAGGSDGATKSAAVSAPSATPAPTGNMTRDFRTFLLRGNVVDLAVGIVIGAAFGRIVSSVVAGLITPIIAAIGGKPNFAALSFTINGSHFHYGLVINAIISFVIVAVAVFFVVVRPINALMSRFRTEPDVSEPTRHCPECRSDIPQRATRCAFCTARVQPVVPART